MRTRILHFKVSEEGGRTRLFPMSQFGDLPQPANAFRPFASVRFSRRIDWTASFQSKGYVFSAYCARRAPNHPEYLFDRRASATDACGPALVKFKRKADPGLIVVTTEEPTLTVALCADEVAEIPDAYLKMLGQNPHVACYAWLAEVAASASRAMDQDFFKGLLTQWNCEKSFMRVARVD